MSKPPSNRLLYFFVAVGAAFPFAVAVAAWSFLRTDMGGFVSSMGRLAWRKQSAPGLAELRALGCDQAIVLTLGEIVDTTTTIFSDEDRAKLADSPERDRPMVQCMVTFGRRPTCEEVVTTYAPFAPDQDQAMARVTSFGRTLCEGIYAATGEYLGPAWPKASSGDLGPGGDEAEGASP